MKTTITISFGFSDYCKEILCKLKTENIITHVYGFLNTDMIETLLRFENFGIVNSSEEYNDRGVLIQKFWLSEVGKAFYNELYEK